MGLYESGSFTQGLLYILFSGGVGVTCWIVVCSSVVYRLKSFVNIQPSSNEIKVD